MSPPVRFWRECGKEKGGCLPPVSSEIEDIAQERPDAVLLLAPVTAVAIAATAARRGFAPMPFTIVDQCAALNDLVQLTSVQPDAPTGGAIVDLDPLTLAHHQKRMSVGLKLELIFVRF